jgi:hypothetical protein
MLSDIDKFANYFIGVSNLSSNFMTKYHENHDYTICRLLNSNTNYNSGFLLEQLKIFDGTLWTAAGGLQKGNRFPDSSASVAGDLWVDTANLQLYLFNGVNWSLISTREIIFALSAGKASIMNSFPLAIA